MDTVLFGHCLCDCSAQQLRQKLRNTLVAAQWRGEREREREKKSCLTSTEASRPIMGPVTPSL